MENKTEIIETKINKKGVWTEDLWFYMGKPTREPEKRNVLVIKLFTFINTDGHLATRALCQSLDNQTILFHADISQITFEKEKKGGTL